MTVATFHDRFVQLISNLGGTPTFNGTPNEVPFPVPFAEDDRDRPYDREDRRALSPGADHRRQCLQPLPHVLPRQVQPGPPFSGARSIWRSPVLLWPAARRCIRPAFPALPDDVAQEA